MTMSMLKVVYREYAQRCGELLGRIDALKADLSASEERERVLREALDKTVWRERSQFPKIPVCVICGAGKEWAAIHGHEPTCALATPAPEPAQPAGQVKP